MRYIISYCSYVSLAILALTGLSMSADTPVSVNLMIDVDVPSTFTDDQVNEISIPVMNLINEIGPRKLTATIFLTQDVTASRLRLLATRIGRMDRYELAMSGNDTDEKLSTNTYSKQKVTLERSQDFVDACIICGVNEIAVKGFMPQSFDQNADTYRVLDELEIMYDAGFQSGILYAPGHENDVWPYKIEDHRFYAVPVSTVNLSGKDMPLVDYYAEDNGLSSTQWYDLLVGKLDEASKNDEPVVVVIRPSVSGNGDYFEAFKKFLDYALSKNAKFVTSMDLVNMSQNGVSELPGLTTGTASEPDTSRDKTSGCAACDENSWASQNATARNETSNIVAKISLDAPN